AAATPGRPAPPGWSVDGGSCANAPAMHQNHAAASKHSVLKRLREVIVDSLLCDTPEHSRDQLALHSGARLWCYAFRSALSPRPNAGPHPREPLPGDPSCLFGSVARVGCSDGMDSSRKHANEPTLSGGPHAALGRDEPVAGPSAPMPC